jgi:Tfp pilus assembly protein PilO
VIVGAGIVVVVVLVALFLVLPKMGQVKDANGALQRAQSQQGTLSSQLAALKQAQAESPKNREIIRKVQQAIPPTVDQQGFFLLLQNAAILSGIDVVTISPSAPVFDPTTNLTTISNALSVTGSYFSITEFLFRIETLPRAAKVIQITLAPGASGASGAAGTGGISMSATVDVFTSDTSAGPGSAPGPTSGAGGTTTPATSTGS